MPVSVRRTPFGGELPGDRRPTRLMTMHFRILKILQPADPSDPPIRWPIITRAQLGARLGLTAISGTVTRALNGVTRAGGKNRPHPGLLALGYVKEVVLDIEGTKEVNYKATPDGVRAYLAHVAAYGEPPPVRNRERCTNDRYRKSEEGGPMD